MNSRKVHYPIKNELRKKGISSDSMSQIGSGLKSAASVQYHCPINSGLQTDCAIRYRIGRELMRDLIENLLEVMHNIPRIT